MCEKHFYAYDSLHGVEKFIERKLCSHAAHGKTCTITEEYRHPHNETPAPAHSTSRVTPSPPLSEASLAGYTGSDRSYQYINGKRVFVSHKRSPSHHLPTSEVQNESNVTLTRRQGTVRPRSENLPPRFTTQHVRYRRRSISIPTTNIHRPHFGGQEAEDKTLRKKTRERIRPSEIDLSFYAPKVLNYAQDLDKDVKSGTYSENNSQKHPPKYLVQKDDSEAKPDLAVSNTNDTRLTRQILPTHETFPRDEDQKDSPESDGDSSSETSQKSAPESLFSTVSTLSSRTNQSLSQEQQGGTELLSDFLFNHPDLNQLYKIAGKKVDVTELQQHLRHFFRYYGQNLKKEASNYQERRASGFVYLFAGHVAKKVSRATVGQLSSRPNKPNRRNVDTWLKDPGSKYASGTDDPDDSDDPDDLSQEYPLLDSVKQFMESSAAFQVLKYDLRDWLRTGDSRDNQAENSQQEDLEVQTSEPRWAITETRLLRTLPEVLDSFLSILHPFLPELAIPLGKTRIRWACSCGQQFYDDFIELEDGALGLLQKSLQENGKTKRNFGYIPSSLQVFLPAVEGLLADLRQRFRHAVTRIGKYCPLRFGATLPSHSGHNPALQSSPQGVGTPCASGRVDRVLLMSIDEGTKYTGLHERQLGSIENDQQLFAFLRRKYYEHKAMPPFFTVRSVALSFSEFLVDIAHFAEVRLHKTCLGTSCTCLPPIERVVDDDEYQCSPAPERPLGYAPPYSSKLLTHYFQNPQCVPDSKRDIFLQLPKRVGPLPLSGDRRVPGWGIHFEEDWHQPTLFLLIWVFFVVGSLAFGIAWSVSKGDVSSAFAVTASWMAIAPILFGFVMARSSARGR